MKKWDYEKRELQPYTPPNTGRYSLIESDMRTVVNCPQCGKEIYFGLCFTSKEIFNDSGCLGYSVCPECYEKEWDRQEEAWRKENKNEIL